MGLMTVPNILTLVRMLLAVPFFVLCTYHDSTAALDVATVLFIIVGLTDIADGYIARRYGSVTKAGRVLDPLSDKVLICGGFIFLIDPKLGVYAWMVAVIVLRELVVNSLRAFTESQGSSYAANVFGKVKMFCESVAIVAILVTLAHFRESAGWLLLVKALMWVAVAAVVVSGIVSIRRALPGLLGKSAADNAPDAGKDASP